MSLWLCLVNVALTIITSNPAKPRPAECHTNEGLTRVSPSGIPGFLLFSCALPPWEMLVSRP